MVRQVMQNRKYLLCFVWSGIWLKNTRLVTVCVAMHLYKHYMFRLNDTLGLNLVPWVRD
jgi:hypothetical protein